MRACGGGLQGRLGSGGGGGGGVVAGAGGSGSGPEANAGDFGGALLTPPHSRLETPPDSDGLETAELGFPDAAVGLGKSGVRSSP